MENHKLRCFNSVEFFDHTGMDVIDQVAERMLYTRPVSGYFVGPRKVDIATLYDTRRYRPKYSSKIGMPLPFSDDA